MRNIPFEMGLQLPKEVQLHRLQQIVREILSPAQRDIVQAYYFQGQSVPQIARNRGVHKSTVLRTLRRAEANLRQYLKY